MNADTPFTRLGLPEDADADAVRDARRRLAKQHHPDRGGDAGQMRSVNAAAAEALRSIDARHADRDASPDAADASPGRTGPDAAHGDDVGEPSWSAMAHDMPSFTVEALPAEAFEALLVAAAVLGEVIDDDPPYRLEARLDAPLRCWCQVDLVPDAGASTVGLAVAPLPGRERPDVLAVRDAWIRELNALDWG